MSSTLVEDINALGYLVALFFAAHRFLSAATIAALPAALSLRFALFGAGAACVALPPLRAAHLFFCAAAIALRPAALILRRGRTDAGVV